MDELEKQALINSVSDIKKIMLALSDHLSDIVYYLQAEAKKQ